MWHKCTPNCYLEEDTFCRCGTVLTKEDEFIFVLTMALEKKTSQVCHGEFTKEKIPSTYFSEVKTQASWTDTDLCCAICHTNILKTVLERFLVCINMGKICSVDTGIVFNATYHTYKEVSGLLSNLSAEWSWQVYLYYLLLLLLFLNIHCSLDGNAPANSVHSELESDLNLVYKAKHVDKKRLTLLH